LTVAENWLYQITLDKIADIHSLNLSKLYNFTGRVAIPALHETGSNYIQIDIVAADAEKKIIVLAEAKEFLTFPGASECAEQLTMKLFHLRYYFHNSLGSDNCQQVSCEDLKHYQLVQYVSLGSYTGDKYSNAKCSSVSDLKVRLDHYSKYMHYIGRSNIGIILFADHEAEPVYRRATLQDWTE
jgi:hypothetical protein